MGGSIYLPKLSDPKGNFWDLYRQLPRETARFVPRFIAAALIISDPQKYGFSLPEPDPPLKFETLTVNYPFKLSALAAALGVDAAELTDLNPELRYDSTPTYEYCLRIPEGYRERASVAVNNLPRWIPPEAQYTWHYVKSGETLSTIADRYHTTASAIARLNGLRSLHYIRPGQRLKIPGRGAAAAPPPPKISAKRGEKASYTVMEGDTLYSIARKFGMNLDDFLILNGLAAQDKIYPGQVVWVVPKS
jgi:membrane-bound lytic murein transglycosylase D